MSIRDRIAAIVLEALNDMNRVRPAALRIPSSPETPLIGAAGALDSIELVTFLFTVESRVSDQTGVVIQLTDSPTLFEAGGALTRVERLVDHLHRAVERDAAATPPTS
jgi:hypothetical protein